MQFSVDHMEAKSKIAMERIRLQVKEAIAENTISRGQIRAVIVWLLISDSQYPFADWGSDNTPGEIWIYAAMDGLKTFYSHVEELWTKFEHKSYNRKAWFARLKRNKGILDQNRLLHRIVWQALEPSTFKKGLDIRQVKLGYKNNGKRKIDEISQ
jgi:hypothetical protein